MNEIILQIGCLLVTLVVYYINKSLYTKWPRLLLMPLLFTPAVLIILMLLTALPWSAYIGETHWLLWLLGPATIAFAVPVYENIRMIRKHWLSITTGVFTAVIVASVSSVLLARVLELPDEIQRSLVVRSVTTPFALSAVGTFGGQPDLAAFFVALTGVCGFAVGDLIFLKLAIRSGGAIGAGFGAASHGAGTARSYQLGEEEGVAASLVMMLSGVLMVVGSPILRDLLF